MSTAAVKRASQAAGFGLFKPDHALSSVLSAGAVKCYKCECEQVNGDAIAQARGKK